MRPDGASFLYTCTLYGGSVCILTLRTSTNKQYFLEQTNAMRCSLREGAVRHSKPFHRHHGFPLHVDHISHDIEIDVEEGVEVFRFQVSCAVA
jgi:hypothetical protein